MWNYFKFGPEVQEEMPLKSISYLELWWPFCSAEWNHLCNFDRGFNEEQFCKIILNLDQWFRRSWLIDISYLELWWPFWIMEQNHLCNFTRGLYGEQLCEFIFNLGQWIRRCRLKDFLSGALAALLFGGAKLFMQFLKRASWETFMWSYMKFRPVVQKEMLFKENV